MNKYFLILAFIVSLVSYSFAQEKKIDSLNNRKNSIRVELSGRALYFSLNYDREIILKKIEIHPTVGIGDFTSRSISFNTSLYIVSNYWKINPIIGTGHISLLSERIPYGPIGLVFTGLDYDELQKWNFQILLTRLFFFYDKDNSQYWGGLSLGYKF